jgi:GT2 family glycosyltransferase
LQVYTKVDPFYTSHKFSSLVSSRTTLLVSVSQVRYSAVVKIGVEQMHKDSKYVLFLDDDARLHPGSIGALTVEMEKNPEVWVFVMVVMM